MRYMHAFHALHRTNVAIVCIDSKSSATDSKCGADRPSREHRRGGDAGSPLFRRRTFKKVNRVTAGELAICAHANRLG